MLARSRLLKIAPKQVKQAVRMMGVGGHGHGHDDDHHHGPMMPPFARLKPPSKTLPEEVELVWNDLVAPEACIDTDARHVSGGQALASFLAGLSFFVLTYLYVSFTDPASRAPIAPRSAVLDEKAYLADMGMIDASEVEDDHAGGHDEEEDEEEEEE